MFPYEQRRSRVPGQQFANDFAQPLDRRALERCLRACIDCEVACLRLLDSHVVPDWMERDLPLIRSCIGCADACAMVTRFFPPGSTLASVSTEQPELRKILMACLLVCSSVEAECRKAALLDARTGECARVSGECAEDCRRVLSILRSIEVETDGIELRPVS